MTRFAFGMPWRGFTTPRDCDFNSAPTAKPAFWRREDKAKEPSPIADLERKARRAWNGNTDGLLMTPVCGLWILLSIKQRDCRPRKGSGQAKGPVLCGFSNGTEGYCTSCSGRSEATCTKTASSWACTFAIVWPPGT